MVQTNDSLTDEVLSALFRAMQQLKQAPLGDPLDRSAVIVLARLKQHGAMRLSDLASDLCLDVSTTSRHVRTLEERGLIERTDDPEDRRAVRLTLAEAGREVLDRAWAARRSWLDTALDGWTREERRALRDCLGRLADALAASSTTPARPTTKEASA